MQRKAWIIRERFIEGGKGWQLRTSRVENMTITQAHYAASEKAKTLDEIYGGSHFWTVDFYCDDGRNESAAQLFHGRLI